MKMPFPLFFSSPGKRIYSVLVITFVTLSSMGSAFSTEVITSDTTWHGEREVKGSLIIPDGVTLTIASGSSVRLTADEDPRQPSAKEAFPLPRILVQGHLEVEGDEGAPVVFSGTGSRGTATWGGIIIDDGNAWLHAAQIHNAKTALSIVKGWVKLKKTVLTNNCCGVVITGAKSGTKIESSTVTANAYGLVIDDRAVVSVLSGTLNGNRKRNILVFRPDAEPDMEILSQCEFSSAQEPAAGQQQHLHREETDQ